MSERSKDWVANVVAAFLIAALVVGYVMCYKYRNLALAWRDAARDCEQRASNLGRVVNECVDKLNECHRRYGEMPPVPALPLTPASLSGKY